MILIKNLKLSAETDFSDINAVFNKAVKTKLNNAKITLFKKSVDSRNKNNIHFVCSFLIESENEESILNKLKNFDADYYTLPKYKYYDVFCRMQRPVVVGFGPAGMFCALHLPKSGLKPIVLEMGKDCDSRLEDVKEFFATGKLNEKSNIQFGEGGAGTFSDGKLNTGISNIRIRHVLEVFCKHGAGEQILYDAKPHIGTDVLINVVKSIRQEIISLGGEIRFENEATNFKIESNRVKGVYVSTPTGDDYIECESVVLAPGHSSRSLFKILMNLNAYILPKPFAIGVRAEHKQSLINSSQYGENYSKNLPVADYKLAAHLENGRNVYSFCMCPGGEVVNASSEAGGIAVNGMSNSKRDGENANSAILVNVNVTDYYKNSALDGIEFQREIEQKAYSIGKGMPVCQTLSSFLDNNDNVITSVKPTVKPDYKTGNIKDIFPDFVTDSLKQGFDRFDKKIKGFANADTVLTAPETRSSSPVVIYRDKTGQSNIRGIYPCGEGSGYAGGITSSAVDGLMCAESVIINNNLKSLKNIDLSEYDL